MEYVQRQFKERAPRFGIQKERLESSGIILGSSPCRFIPEEGDALQLETQSIVNISVGGIKLTVANPDKTVLDGMELQVEFQAPSAEKVYKLKGKVSWSEHLTGGNTWIGVELRPRPDVLNLFTELTGEEP